MVSERKIKGDIATIKAIADLTIKGYVILTPTVCEHLPFDFIAYKDGKSLRIQAKYSSSGMISNKNVWNDKYGSHIVKYASDAFDYYAVYLPEVDAICYPNISFGGSTLRSREVNSPTPYYWYEDFLNFTDVVAKRKREYEPKVIKIKEKRIKKERKLSYVKVQNPNYIRVTRIVWPVKDELEKMLWEKPSTKIARELGVSDRAITKRARKYGIPKPTRGYWAKLAAGKIKPGPDQTT